METTAILNIAAANLTLPLTAAQNASIISAVNSTLTNFTDITRIALGSAQVYSLLGCMAGDSSSCHDWQALGR